MKWTLRFRIITLVVLTSLSVVSATVITVHKVMLDAYAELVTERETSEIERLSSELSLSLQQRQFALEAFAARFVDENGALLSTQQLQELLTGPSVAKNLFPDGLLAFNSATVAVAESVRVPGRLGTSYADREHFQRATETKSSVISEPILGRVTGLPLVSFLNPIVSPDNEIVGYAGGILDLSQTPLLTGSANENVPQGEGIITLVLDPRHRLFVHMQQRFEKPEPLPEPGTDALVDAAVSMQPSGTLVDYNNQTFIMASKQIDPLGWVVVRAVPYTSAVAPAQTAFHKLLIVTAVIIIIIGALGAWIARRIMLPISHITDRIDTMANDARFDSEFKEQGAPELRALARAMNRLADERKTVDHLKDAFVATVSHELRTPLSSVVGGLKLLEGYAAKNAGEKERTLLALCSRNADRLGILINDLLDFSQVMAGKASMRLEACSLLALAEQATQDMLPKAQQKDLRFTLSIPTQSWVQADANRLRQVFDNVLSNAVKHAPEGSEIQVAASQSPTEHWRLTISDQGKGIPDNFKSRIFQPFSQADHGDMRSVSGTGLGLAISKAYIEQMQGQMGFYNDNGAHFWWELRVSKAKPAG